MEIDPILYSGRPARKRSPEEEAIYDRLDELHISYDRADHSPADTMEDCLLIEATLGAKICKNLFLCNRQQTAFYLLMMQGEKPFKTKYLSSQIGSARLSFAGPEHLQRLLHTVQGSVSALELLFDTELNVQLLIDKPLMQDEYISGHPGHSTSTVRMRREDLLAYVRSTGHEPTVVDLPAVLPE